MKKTCLPLLIFLSASSVHADEIKCNPSGSMIEMIKCAADEYQKNDKLLNERYKIAMKKCDEYFPQNAKECKNSLLKAQRNWSTYKESMHSYIYGFGPNGGGSLGRLEAAQFLADETKKQADLLNFNE